MNPVLHFIDAALNDTLAPSIWKLVQWVGYPLAKYGLLLGRREPDRDGPLVLLAGVFGWFGIFLALVRLLLATAPSAV